MIQKNTIVQNTQKIEKCKIPGEYKYKYKHKYKYNYKQKLNHKYKSHLCSRVGNGGGGAEGRRFCKIQRNTQNTQKT